MNKNYLLTMPIKFSLVFLPALLFCCLFVRSSSAQEASYSKEELLKLCEAEYKLTIPYDQNLEPIYPKKNGEYGLSFTVHIKSVNGYATYWDVTTVPPIANDNGIYLMNAGEKPRPLETIPSIDNSLTASPRWSFSFLDKKQAAYIVKNNINGLYPVIGNTEITQVPRGFFEKFKRPRKYSHANSTDQVYAIDIKANLGSDVVAFNAGTVVWIEGRFEDYGCGKIGFPSGGNSVRVLHADGTTAYYHHLMKGSIIVDIGQSIQEGDKLARVGDSGASSFPHLHFQIDGMTEDGIRSFPVKFYTTPLEKPWKPKKSKIIINLRLL